MNILFICSSNICRSPYCEFWFKRMVAEDPELAKIVKSVRSGAVKFRYHHIYPMTASCLISDGFDEKTVMAHKPSHKWFEPDIFEQADLILGMSRKHYLLLPKKWKNKYAHLTEFVLGTYKPIKDPWWDKRLNQSGFNARMLELNGYLKLLAEKLKQDYSH